jgi:hypothetical protein
MFSSHKLNFARSAALALATMIIGLATVTAGPMAAQGINPWKVEGRLAGKPKDEFLNSKKSEDVSGIACGTEAGFPRVCLLVDDETQGAQIVVLEDGKLVAGDFVRLIYNTHDGDLLELDAEGVAYGDGSFYVIGSHGRPRHEADATKEAKNEARAKASRYVFRVAFDLNSVDRSGRLAGAIELKPSVELATFITAEPALASSFDRALDENGLTIEGVAVRDSRLYVGMRGPLLDDNTAAVLSVPLEALFEGQQGAAQLHRLDLGKRHGVRDMVAFESGFLLLAGPVNDPPNGEIKHGDYSIFSWDGTTHSKLLSSLEPFGNKVKPEALLPLGRSGTKLHTLLFFDGSDEGTPRPVEIEQP